MSLKSDFIDDPLAFMSSHAIGIKAAGPALLKLNNYDDFRTMSLGSRKVSLDAPSGYAKFTEIRPKATHDYIKCSVPELELELADSATELPVYVIPYMGTAAAGVKLPAGPGPAYAITTKIDGCTFTVSGSPGSPYASHANAYIKGGTEQEKMDKMRDHILMMDRMFIREELTSGGDVRTVSENLVHFNHWFRPQVGRPGAFVNYAEFAQQRVQLEVNSGEHHYRSEATIGHRKYHVKLSDTCRVNIAAPTFVPKNAVIGVREAGAWAFYTSSFWDVDFDVRVEHKLKGLTVKTRNEVFSATVVLTYGQLWPEPELFYKPFVTQLGDLPK